MRCVYDPARSALQFKSENQTGLNRETVTTVTALVTTVAALYNTGSPELGALRSPRHSSTENDAQLRA